MSKNVPEIIFRHLAGTVWAEIDYYDETNDSRLDRIRHEQEAAAAEDALFDRRRDEEAS